MAHYHQQKFVTDVRNRFPEHFIKKVVLDAGSLDVNGNNRGYFQDCFYLGADVDFGSNVDIKSEIYKLPFRDNFFDTIISTEMLEHDATYYLTLNKLIRLLKSGGLLVFTCATTDRPEHGTLNSDLYSSPLTINIPIWANYYKNLTEQDIRSCINIEEIFNYWLFEINNESKDLYFYGFKK